MTDVARPSEKRALEVVDATCSDASCKGMGAYRLAVACMNCQWKGGIAVTKGHEFSKYAASCPNCGCSTLSRVIT